jgi:hypothetical protein
MNKEVEKVFNDLRNMDLPRESGIDKIKCSLFIGQKVKWYYKDDLEYWKEYLKEENDDPRSCATLRGMVIPRPGVDYRGGEFEYDEVIIINYDYECEKDYPEVEWIALPRLLDSEDLVEIFDEED